MRARTLPASPHQGVGVDFVIAKATNRCAIARRLLCRLSKNAGHGFPLGQLVDQFVEVADLLHERVSDVFDTHSTHDAGDERRVHLGLRVTPIAKGQQGLFDVPKVLRALGRGAACQIDFSDHFDFFRFAPERLDSLRARWEVPPLAIT